MNTITYTLILLSDAEIGSGSGNESVNDIVAKDHKGHPVLRGSHLKGLLRDQLKRIGDGRDWKPLLDEYCFGQKGEDGGDGTAGLARFPDAPAADGQNARVRTITRTSLTELGVVAGQTLRTSEAVHAGTHFKGNIQFLPGTPAVVETAIRLALLTLEAVGGGRTRGSGACRIDIEEETRSPGTLLRTLDAELGKSAALEVKPVSSGACHLESGKPATILRLLFDADDPICCPDTPVVSNNVIQSGLGVPASAVLGAIITRLAQTNPELASRTIADIRTRAWPLLPCGWPGDAGPMPTPVHVSLSHKMSKLAREDGHYEFRDSAIESYDWRTVPGNVLLKGSSGVLLWKGKGDVSLWKIGDMPQVLTAHAVHLEDRNLFTVKAQAPMAFSGWISLPAEAAKELEKLLAQDPRMTFGKSRTIRGSGRLAMEFAPWPDTFNGWQNRVFVLQSPAAIPDDWDLKGISAEEVLARLLRESGWGELAAPGEGPAKGIVTQASCAMRFGWNRHGLGKGIGSTKRLRARRVFLPGTVFVLKQAPADLKALLLRGLGFPAGDDVDGRIQGFGAVLPHPGIAKGLFQKQSKLPIRESDEAGKLAMAWFRKAGSGGPSPSQISAVVAMIREKDGAKAADYLDKQKTERPPRIWDRWNPVFEDVKTVIRERPEIARQALRTWQDLAIINRKDKEG